VPLAVK
ncbi:putative membrane protein, partial [Chlamydia psittaci 84-8471/1]